MRASALPRSKITSWPFDALDRGVDDFVHASDVLVVNRVALGLTHLLEDHLLGQLRGDAPQTFSRLFLQQFAADHGVFADLQRLFQRDLHLRIFDVVFAGKNLPHRIGADCAALAIQHGAQVLLRLVILARGDDDGVFDGRYHDLRIDSLLAAQCVDHVVKFTCHIPCHLNVYGAAPRLDSCLPRARDGTSLLNFACGQSRSELNLMKLDLRHQAGLLNIRECHHDHARALRLGLLAARHLVQIDRKLTL